MFGSEGKGGTDPFPEPGKEAGLADDFSGDGDEGGGGGGGLNGGGLFLEGNGDEGGGGGVKLLTGVLGAADVLLAPPMAVTSALITLAFGVERSTLTGAVVSAVPTFPARSVASTRRKNW